MNSVADKTKIILMVYDYCIEKGLTPFIAVRYKNPPEVLKSYIKDGVVILNLSLEKAANLFINDEGIFFDSRFSGVIHSIVVPIEDIYGVFPKELPGEGITFLTEELNCEKPETDIDNSTVKKNTNAKSVPFLRLVK